MTTRPRIAFQGEPGANSDEACRAYFPDYEPVPHASFEDAFEAVKSGAGSPTSTTCCPPPDSGYWASASNRSASS
jgi:hypothetical protein